MRECASFALLLTWEHGVGRIPYESELPLVPCRDGSTIQQGPPLDVLGFSMQMFSRRACRSEMGLVNDDTAEELRGGKRIM